MRSPRASYHATPIQQQLLQSQSRAMHEYPLCWIFIRHGEPARRCWLWGLVQARRCYLASLILFMNQIFTSCILNSVSRW